MQLLKYVMLKEPCPRNGIWSQVHYTTNSSLWVDLGMVMMDDAADLSFGSAELDFVNSTSNPGIIKPGQNHRDGHPNLLC